MFDGRQYLDGTISFSVRRALLYPEVRAYDPTDILLVINNNETWLSHTHLDPTERFASLFSHHFERLLLNRIRIADDLDFLAGLEKKGLTVGVIASPKTKKHVGNLTCRPKLLWSLGNASLKHTLECFGKPDLYEPLPAPKKKIR